MILRGLVIVHRDDDHRDHFKLIGEFLLGKVKTQEQLDFRSDALMTEYAMTHNANYDCASHTLRIND